jgi:hypothetical protein
MRFAKMNSLENNSLFNLLIKNDRIDKIGIMVRVILKIKIFKYSNSFAKR